MVKISFEINSCRVKQRYCQAKCKLPCPGSTVVTVRRWLVRWLAGWAGDVVKNRLIQSVNHYIICSGAYDS